MQSNPRIAALCGSLRDQSTTRAALAHTLGAAQQHGAETDLIDLRNLDLPLYDADQSNAGDAPELTERLRAADGVVLGTPVYHGSYASALKTALDYCGFEELEDKPVGLLTVAGGQFPTPGVMHLHAVCVWLRAHPLPHHVAVPNASEVIENGQITDSDTARRAETLGERITRRAVQMSVDPKAAPALD
jgi:NAD(P)H-dependent FMN reductase